MVPTNVDNQQETFATAGATHRHHHDLEKSNKKKSSNSSSSSSAQKPKRPLSAYNIFFQSERQKLLLHDNDETQDGNGNNSKNNNHKNKKIKMPFGGLARYIAAKWRKIDSESLAHYQELAAQEQKRYMNDLVKWKIEEAHERHGTYLPDDKQDHDDSSVNEAGAVIATTSSNNHNVQGLRLTPEVNHTDVANKSSSGTSAQFSGWQVIPTTNFVYDDRIHAFVHKDFQQARQPNYSTHNSQAMTQFPPSFYSSTMNHRFDLGTNVRISHPVMNDFLPSHNTAEATSNPHPFAATCAVPAAACCYEPHSSYLSPISYSTSHNRWTGAKPTIGPPDEQIHPKIDHRGLYHLSSSWQQPQLTQQQQQRNDKWVALPPQKATTNNDGNDLCNTSRSKTTVWHWQDEDNLRTALTTTMQEQIPGNPLPAPPPPFHARDLEPLPIIFQETTTIPLSRHAQRCTGLVTIRHPPSSSAPPPPPPPPLTESIQESMQLDPSMRTSGLPFDDDDVQEYLLSRLHTESPTTNSHRLR